jgi:hypothetical protein
MSKSSKICSADLREKVLANARECWLSFVAWDQLSRSRELPDVPSLFFSTQWQFLPFEKGLFVDVLIRMVVLFDNDADQVSFNAYRKLDPSLPAVDPKYAAAIKRVQSIRHNAVAHWNSQQNLSGWLSKFELSVNDIELVLMCVREQHDFLLAMKLENPPDTFAILDKSERKAMDAFIEVLRDAARFRLVDAQQRAEATAYYTRANTE